MTFGFGLDFYYTRMPNQKRPSKGSFDLQNMNLSRITKILNMNLYIAQGGIAGHGNVFGFANLEFEKVECLQNMCNADIASNTPAHKG